MISRDVATCQHCGAAGVELHAHHVKPHRDFPELRWDVSNGITLCYACHWEVHSACDANGVNSGKPAAGQAGGNPEPSFGRKPVEGVTTRGRAYRRWDGNCNYCGTAVSKRWSDVKGKRHVFCSRSCSAKFQWQNNPPVHGSNASTSSPRESDDIV
ncbi:MAG: HNH endonuclease [Planctomycetales bacterium]|nr:HNH endonuclease [Planctomycetales bacterium]